MELLYWDAKYINNKLFISKAILTCPLTQIPLFKCTITRTGDNFGCILHKLSSEYFTGVSGQCMSVSLILSMPDVTGKVIRTGQ